MSNIPPMAVESNRAERLIHVQRFGAEIAVFNWAEARYLIGQFAAALLEAGAYEGLTGARLGQLLDDLTAGLGHYPAEDSRGYLSGSMGTDEIPPGIEGNRVGNRRARCEHCGVNVAVVGERYASHTRPQGDACRDSGRPLHRD